MYSFGEKWQLKLREQRGDPLCSQGDSWRISWAT